MKTSLIVMKYFTLIWAIVCFAAGVINESWTAFFISCACMIIHMAVKAQQTIDKDWEDRYYE